MLKDVGIKQNEIQILEKLLEENKMSEEEIIKYIKDEIENETDTYHWFDNTPDNKTRKQIEESINAHQGLLDLYQKEIEKNKELDRENQALYESINCDDKNMLERLYKEEKEKNKKLEYQLEIENIDKK